jgi:long-chain fatty acid transport protein
MMRHGLSRIVGVAAGVSLAAWAGSAAASSGLDSPDSGVVQSGRGSAWFARADDPLAAYFNPAAMAFLPTSVHAGAQIMMQNRCYTRLGPDGKPVSAGPGIPAPLLPGQAQLGDGSVLPSAQVCSEFAAFPNPQVAATFRVHDKVAIGLALVAPHASGSNNWPESLPYKNAFGADVTMPSPQRYMLVESHALLIFPTISVAWAPTDYLAFGAGFIWGIGTAEFVNFSEAVSPAPMAGMPATDHAGNDVRAQLKAKDLMIPGFVLSGLWMPTNNLDVSAWFKWQDALDASADINLQSLYWKTSGVRNDQPCAMGSKADCNVTDAKDAGRVHLQIPMEAKIGLRYHMPRATVTDQPSWMTSKPDRKFRDPLSQDIFDIEVDFTWANNSAVQDLELTFKPGIKINDGSPTGVGENANIPHKWKDVVGVRLGGDFVAIPNRLALRTGGFFEIKGQDAEYLQLDFNLAQKVGVAGGATVRVGPVDISVSYAHTFFGTLDNGGKGKLNALSGDASGLTTPEGMPVCGADPKNPVIGPGCFRSWQAVNGGVLKASLNEIGIAATARF